MTQLSRILRFSLTTANAPGLAAFYQEAFGCVRIAADRQSGTAFEAMTGVQGGADRITLALGHDVIELIQFDNTGASYPPAATASDLCFQHFAIVVLDMALAWQRLGAVKGWTAITTGPPQKLPATAGGVTAFKFRDPEGHPLELLMFPHGKGPVRWQVAPQKALFAGVDHSAISVSDSDASVAFYNAMGLVKASFSDNHGPAQNVLDGLEPSRVVVTALQPADCTPHLELLAYQGASKRRGKPVEANDIACTRLVFESAHSAFQSLIDLDGHRMIVVPGSRGDGLSSQARL